jgi:hypothetical protein
MRVLIDRTGRIPRNAHRHLLCECPDRPDHSTPTRIREDRGAVALSIRGSHVLANSLESDSTSIWLCCGFHTLHSFIHNVAPLNMNFIFRPIFTTAAPSALP